MVKRVVLLDWVQELSLKQQSVLLSSLRGPDNFYYPKLKEVTKWIRSILQINADFEKDYMRCKKLPLPNELEKEIEFCTVHYSNHLLNTLEIIGYKHPDERVSTPAKNYYFYFVDKVFHLNPETQEQLDKRLEDKTL